MSVCPGMSMLLISFQFVIVIGSFTEESQLYCIVLYCYEPYLGLNGKTLKSGCGLYIRSGLTFIQRKDLDLQYYDDLNEFQMKFIEVVIPKGSNIILSVTYRHPKKTSNHVLQTQRYIE